MRNEAEKGNNIFSSIGFTILLIALSNYMHIRNLKEEMKVGGGRREMGILY